MHVNRISLFLENDHIEGATEKFLDLLASYRDTILNNVAGPFMDSIESFVDTHGLVGWHIYYHA